MSRLVAAFPRSGSLLRRPKDASCLAVARVVAADGAPSVVEENAARGKGGRLPMRAAVVSGGATQLPLGRGGGSHTVILM